MNVFKILLFVGLTFQVCCYFVEGGTAERKLFEYIFKDYDPQERPVVNESFPLLVNMSVTLLRIANLDEAKRHVELIVWQSLEWEAYNVKWTPEKYNGIKGITVDFNKVWSPDIYLYNQVGDVFDTTHKTKVVFEHNGKASYIPPGIVTTECVIQKETKYPFEQFSCELKYGSWTHNGQKIELEMKDEGGGDISSYSQNAEWDLLGFPGKKTTNIYECCPEPYYDLTFTLHIKRKGDTILSSANSINCIISGMIFISLLLVPSSGFKIIMSLCAMGLCAYSSLLFNPKGYVEPTELSLYFSNLLFVTFCVLFTNVITYHIHDKLGTVPNFVKTYLDKCPVHRPRNETEYNVGERRETITHEQNYNDLQILTSRSNQVGISDWRYLSFVLDKCFFIFWIVFVFIFYLAAYPSYYY